MNKGKLLFVAGTSASVVSFIILVNGSILPALITAVAAIAAFVAAIVCSDDSLYDQVFEEAVKRDLPHWIAEAVAVNAVTEFGPEPCTTSEQLEHVFKHVLGERS